LDVERSAFDVCLLHELKGQSSSSYHRARLNGESGLERTDAGACGGDSASQGFCRDDSEQDRSRRLSPNLKKSARLFVYLALRN
jgi:hypothetical protein